MNFMSIWKIYEVKNRKLFKLKDRIRVFISMRSFPKIQVHYKIIFQNSRITMLITTFFLNKMLITTT